MRSKYEHFSSVISTIYRCIQKIERDEMVKYGYKGSHAQYLMAIASHPEGLTARQLCELCDKDKAAISRALSDMEERELVCRIGGDSMYRAKVYLTEKGKRITDIVEERAFLAVSAGGEGLTDEERRVFYVALDRVADNLHKINAEGIPGK